MAILDIFTGDAFSSVTMAQAIEDSGYVPNQLTSMNIFKFEGITTEGVAIERRTNSVSLVPVTPRGSAVPQQGADSARELSSFRTTRIAKGDRLNASELDFVRKFGEEQAVERAKEELARKLGTGNGDQGILDDMSLTFEKMMLDIVTTAKFTDKDGNVLVDWGTELRTAEDVANNVPFAIAVETFDFSTLVDGALREKLNKIGRSMRRQSRGKFMHNTSVKVLVGDEFFDALGKNAEIRNHVSRNAQVSYVQGNDAWGTIEYAGFSFTNYRGTDDNETVAIKDGEGHAFPTNTRGIFKHYGAHGESFADLGTKGRKFYVDITPDLVKDRFVDIEVMSYPLLACTVPEILRKFVLA